MTSDEKTAWPPLRTAGLNDRVRRDEARAYLDRHSIERTRALGPKDALTDVVVAPMHRWRLVANVLGWSRGKRGFWHATLFVPSIVIAVLLSIAGVAVMFLLLILGFAFTALAVIDLGYALFSTSEGIFGSAWIVFAPVFIAGWLAFLHSMRLPVRRQMREARRGVAFERFAGANGMHYRARRQRTRAERSPEALAGAIHRVRRRGDAAFEAGVVGPDLEGTTDGNGRGRWGYTALRFPTGLPHILLDARGSNGVLSSSLPGAAVPHGSQRLGLEGDFDRFFTLYCPDGYEPDALYLFSPDVMAHMIDRAARHDIEIVDDWLVLYSKSGLGTTDPADGEAMYAALEALTDRARSWRRWRDERHHDDGPRASRTALPTPPRGASDEGRRMRRAPVAVAVFACVFAVLLVGVAGWAFWEMTVEFFADVCLLFSWIGSLF